MASRKKTKKKSNIKKTTDVKKDSSRALNNEIQGAVISAVALLFFVCLFIRETAVVPKYIADVMFGVFGAGAYLVPPIVFIVGLCRIFLKKIDLHTGKIISTIFFCFAVSGILHIILMGDSWVNSSFTETVSNVYSYSSQAAFPLSMGAFCAICLYPFMMLFGTVATIVILLCIIAVSVILLFNFSYREAGEKVKTKIGKMHDNAQRKSIDKNDYTEPEPKHSSFSIRHKKVKMYDEQLSPKKSSTFNREIIEDIDEPMESPLSFEASDTVPINNEDFVLPDTNESDDIAHTENVANIADDITEERDDAIPPEYDADEIKPNDGSASVSAEFNSFDLPEGKKPYSFPPISLLSPAKPSKNAVSTNYSELAAKLERTLASFGIKAHVINYTVGPAITRYELTIQEGIRVNKILQLSDDIALCMAATGVRIEAPIPGKSAIGIEIPNSNITMVTLREVLESDNFTNHSSCVAIGLGKDITGRAIVADIAKMPHLLIAGQTGSGKSVAINSLIVSILYKANPDEVKLILVDPKQVELSIYNGIPHLLLPVVTDPKKAAGALQYVVRQMERRYSEFNKHRVKDIYRYNEQAAENGEPIMPRIIVIVDELNDLMMVCPGEVEDSVLRIAQLARAAGIYLVLATQRPSVNVITGVIKANIPSRMAFAVSSSHDSKTILDRVGAERLVGKGDMLYHHNGESKPIRVQGAYVDERDIEKIVEFVKENSLEPEYIDEEEIVLVDGSSKNDDYDPEEEGYDELIFKAVEVVMQCQQASISMLQRKLGIGYARAGRLIDSMEKMNIVGPAQGSKQREILITQEQYIQNFKRK